jgi:Uma2 family endonuclease
MAINIKRYSVEDFEAFVNLPENADKFFEFIGGEIFEVPSNPYSSEISILVATAISNFVKPRKLGHVTGEAGGYMVYGERYAPDVAFISKEKQAKLARNGYNPNPPDLAVEVISPNDNQRQTMIKVANYLSVGTVVWVVYPESKEVEVYAPSQAVRVLGINDSLDGASVLEGFNLAVHEIFPEEED